MNKSHIFEDIDETKTKFTDSFDHDAIVTYIDEIVDNLSRGKFKFIIEK